MAGTSTTESARTGREYANESATSDQYANGQALAMASADNGPINEPIEAVENNRGSKQRLVTQVANKRFN